MTDLLSPLDYLRSQPTASRKEVMKQCGCSARAARLAEEQFAGERIARRQRRRYGSVAVIVLIGAAAAVYSHLPTETTDKSPDPQHVAAVQAAERSIYSALDRGDKAQASQIAEKLRSKDEPLRLAALRFLAKVDPAPYRDRLLPLTNDASPRVRLAAIQLAGRLEGEQVQDTLALLLRDPKRPLNERLIAANVLETRPSKTRVRLARQLLPVLLDEQPALRARVSRLLAKLTNKTPEGVIQAPAPGKKPLHAKTLHARWTAALEETS